MTCVIVGLEDSAGVRAAEHWATVYADARGTDLGALIPDRPIGSPLRR